VNQTPRPLKVLAYLLLLLCGPGCFFLALVILMAGVLLLGGVGAGHGRDIGGRFLEGYLGALSVVVGIVVLTGILCIGAAIGLLSGRRSGRRLAISVCVLLLLPCTVLLFAGFRTWVQYSRTNDLTTPFVADGVVAVLVLTVLLSLVLRYLFRPGIKRFFR
jgi:hypothetical protein